MKHLYLLILLFTFLQNNGFSQIVNIEDKRSVHADTAGIFGNANIGFNLLDNGSTILNFQSSGQLEVLKNRHLWLYMPHFNLIKVEDKNKVNRGFQHLRYNFKINETLTYEAFTQWQYNQKLRIKLRMLSGTGIRFQLLKKEKQKVYLGLAYMYEYDEIKDTSIVYRDHRLSSYFSFNLQAFSNLTLSGTTYFQPVITEFSEFRISTKTTATFKITDKLSFNVSFSLTHDTKLSRDVPGVPATVYSMVNGLRFSF